MLFRHPVRITELQGIIEIAGGRSRTETGKIGMGQFVPLLMAQVKRNQGPGRISAAQAVEGYMKALQSFIALKKRDPV